MTNYLSSHIKFSSFANFNHMTSIQNPTPKAKSIFYDFCAITEASFLHKPISVISERQIAYSTFSHFKCFICAHGSAV